MSCSVQTGRAIAEAGLHPATGGDGSLLCSGDMLLPPTAVGGARHRPGSARSELRETCGGVVAPRHPSHAYWALLPGLDAILAIEDQFILEEIHPGLTEQARCAHTNEE